MPQVTIRRPFSELALGDELRFEPRTVLHFFFGQGPLGPFLFGQILSSPLQRLSCSLIPTSKS